MLPMPCGASAGLFRWLLPILPKAMAVRVKQEQQRGIATIEAWRGSIAVCWPATVQSVLVSAAAVAAADFSMVLGAAWAILLILS
jgi:hypothetical protein